jgi:hypothetical protein
MNVLSLLDIPSLLFSCSAIVAGGICGGRNIRKSCIVARDISIPIGIVGTLIGFVNLLSMMDDPSMLLPSIIIAFLTTFYSVIIFVLCHTLSTWYPKLQTPPQNSIILQNGSAIGVLLVFLLIAMNYNGSLFIFIDVTSIAFVFLLVLLPTFLQKQDTSDQKSYLEHKSRVICKYSMITMVVAMLYSGVSLLIHLEDLSAIGPAMAIGLLTPLYCSLFIIVGRMVSITIADPQPMQDIYMNVLVLSMMLGIVVFVLFCIAILFSVI